MKIRKIYSCLFFGLIIILFSCTSDYSKDLGDGYFYRNEGEPLNDIHSKKANGGQIPANVLSYAYDKDFIIAKQKPKLPPDPLYDKEYKYPKGSDDIYFWVIIKNENTVLGPMNKGEFEKARKKHKVPDDLELKSVD